MAGLSTSKVSHKLNYKQRYEKLPFALLGYRTTGHASTGATSYLLVYGTDAVIPAEVEIPSLRIIQEAELSDAEWIQSRYEQLDLIDRKRMNAFCNIALDNKVLRQYIKYALNILEHDILNWDDDMIVLNWKLEDIHDGVGEGGGEDEGESEGEGDGRYIREPRYVASHGRPRLNRYRGRIDSYFRSSQTGGGSGVRGNRRGRSSGRSGGRSGDRGGGRG
uniref:Uncharacterized protein LOC104249520 n=1 Tax=Nicotiana sylvestris TaxID=4096 RepID=A0A1U7YJJ0_NICSY|nr:PREDICTED: uncharacterized protein LOC104249520 [Nicotiana sylvestris]